MKRISVVAIVGRPNVGKSSLFNMLAGKKISIVDDESGVTRDRVYADVEWRGHSFSVIDTGGIEFGEGEWNAHIREQVDIAVDLSDCIIMLTDAAAGVLPADIEIANLLRRTKKKVILAVNKADNQTREAQLYDFYQLKMGEPVGISCVQNRGIGDLLDAVFEKITDKLPREHFKLDQEDESGQQQDEGNEAEETPRIAIVGKPNAGKSSIVNRLLGTKRVMVSDIAGTTRDSIDSPFRFEGRNYILTDTAGIRRKRSVEVETIEHYSVLRALAAIRNSDVCVLVVDAAEGLTEQDVRLAGYIHEEGKPSVIVINKWDLIEKDAYTMNEYNKKLNIDLAFMPYFRAIYISAETGTRIGEIMKNVEFVLERTKTRVTTGVLNTLIGEFTSTTPPPVSGGGRRAKFLYSTQVGIAPPTFALFVNNKDIVPSTYLRYLENCLRKSIDFSGTPIRLLLRNREEKK